MRGVLVGMAIFFACQVTLFAWTQLSHSNEILVDGHTCTGMKNFCQAKKRKKQKYIEGLNGIFKELA